MIHKNSHPCAGQVVTITSEASHPQFPKFAGEKFRLEDYWDRVSGSSWMDTIGNPAVIIYTIRVGNNNLPIDNEVVYGKLNNGLGVILHVSEIASCAHCI